MTVIGLPGEQISMFGFIDLSFSLAASSHSNTYKLVMAIGDDFNIICLN